MKRIKIRAKLKIFFGDIYFCEEADKVLGGCLRATSNTKHRQRRTRPPNIHKKVVCPLALPGGIRLPVGFAPQHPSVNPRPGDYPR
jgi:hypothetical protein